MKRIIGVAAAIACAASLSAFANGVERAEHKADKAQAEADYKAAKVQCKTMRGEEKKACLKEAKANYKAEKKQVHAAHEMREDRR